MRVCKQQCPAQRTDQREDQCRTLRADTTRPHGPLEETEGDGQGSKSPVLQDLRIVEALPEPVGAERPVLRIGAQKDEAGEGQENERPMPRSPRTPRPPG